MGKRRTATTTAGVGLGAILVAPAAAHGEDIRVTNLNGDGSGSLRAAVEAANADADADRVVFKSKLSGTIDLDGNDIEATFADLEIVGPGARRVTVSGGNAGGVFGLLDYNGAIDAAISGLTIADGVRGEGSGIRMVGDVDVELSRVTIARNEATDQEGAGAVFFDGNNQGSLQIERSTISNNESTADGAYGGGMFVTQADEFALLNSTISGNTAGEDGGGIYVTDNPSSTVQIRNSTIANNLARTDDGGGIWAFYPVEVRGSIVANNSADAVSPDVHGDEFSAAFSLIEDTDTDDDPIDDQGGNVFGVDPRLKALKNNGGPTDTHAFKKSPAKNKGPSDAPNQDQRGAPRKGKPDIGAYELAKCEGVIVNRVGTAGKDKLKGTKKKDGILGLGGNDKLSGKKGKDGLCGGSGKDKLKGGPGKDKLDGGPGKDKEVQ
jgi:Ca2+-binding RTX toxin-like protein